MMKTLLFRYPFKSKATTSAPIRGWTEKDGEWLWSIAEWRVSAITDIQ